jgi:hypothetical protein
MACQHSKAFTCIFVTLCMQSLLAQAVLEAVERARNMSDPYDLDSLPYNQAAALMEQTVSLLTLLHRYEW